MSLMQQQREATLPSLTMVKAGAGAGKTYRIQQDLTQWIREGLVRPDKILAVTFTNAAANEMKERIRQNLIKEGMKTEANLVQNATISTIHGFGLNTIEQFCYEQGISPNPRQLTEAEQNQLIRRALTQVSSINTLLADLDQFGYQGRFNGKDYTDGATQLKNRVLRIISSLRSLGKGNETLDAQSSIDLLESAKATLKKLYGENTSNADTLNRALWNAIQDIKIAYPDITKLEDEWASNGATRAFVVALQKATSEELKTNWKLWIQLQTIGTAPKIFGKKKEHPHAGLALSVWQAADKLSVHPGPLNDAIEHIEALLQSAIETLSKYQEMKTQSGLIDFGDMVHLAEQNMLNPEFLEEAKQNYDCLIIDEFQDTNPLQFSLLRQFQKAGLPTFIVGDLKQSIMGFQGSDSRLFSSLLTSGELDSEIKVDELKNNWRSTPELMEFINAAGERLYQDNYQRLTVDDHAVYSSDLPAVHQLVFDKENWSLGKTKSKFSVNHDGIYALAHHINELLSQETLVTDKNTRKKRPIRASDIAVLAPTHKRLTAFAKQLKTFGLNTKLTQQGFLESESSQWTICALQYVANFKNQLAVLNLITSEYAHVDLQQALSEFMEHKHFLHPVVKQLDEASKQIQLMDFESAVLSVIELLDIWNKVQVREDAEQQRANLTKLISLSGEFAKAQPESLEAMGIYGKNLNTFVVWLYESANEQNSEVNSQPHTELNSDDAVVLSTWHASKGLEWPVVMILDAHEEKKPKLPAIDMAYRSDDVESMLDTSFVRLLMDFDDESTQKKMLDELMGETIDTLKNLTYVAITRAREHLIIPWFDNQKDNSMLSMLSSVFEEPSFSYQSKNMVLVDEVEQTAKSKTAHAVLSLIDQDKPELVPSVVSPSIHDHKHKPESSEIETVTYQYAKELDLKKCDEVLAANEIGDVVHRLFEVYLMDKSLFERAFNILPVDLQENMSITSVANHLDKFTGWVNEQLQPIKVECEVPILATNAQGQTVSGMIDMLVEAEDGYWIVDHKTDKEVDISKHTQQLQAYANSLKLDKAVKGLAVNWVRTGIIEVMSLR
jgi:ATP-dependent exoDNAse (exonuclease V) beta subunit